MSAFILVWMLVIPYGPNRPTTYSPPVQTLEDCKRLQEASMVVGNCVSINVLRSAR
jgi:hypothetical protein